MAAYNLAELCLDLAMHLNDSRHTAEWVKHRQHWESIQTHRWLWDRVSEGVCVCVCVCVWVVERQSIFLYQIKAGLLMCSVSAHSALSVLRTDSVTGERQKTFLFLWPLCSSPPVSSCRSAHTLSFWCNCLSEKKKKKRKLDDSRVLL